MNRRIKVLVVEDEVFIAKTIKRGLELYGYRVPETFMSGGEAFDYIDKNDFHYDIALVDIKLKGTEDGIHVAETLKKKYDIPTVFTTACTKENILDRAKALNPLGYMVKPFSTIDLHTTLQVALQKLEQEEAALEKRHWLATTLNSFKLPIITTEITGKIKYINHYCMDALGLNASNIGSKNILEILGIDHENRILIHNYFERLKQTNETSLFRGDVKLDHGNNEKIAINILPIKPKKYAIGAMWIFKDKNSSDDFAQGGTQDVLDFSSKIVEVSDEFKSNVRIHDNVTVKIESDAVFSDIIGKSDKMVGIFETIKQIANANSNVLILGETGTGKEVIARAIHKMSLRKNNKFVPIDCVAIPDSLMESELFGFEKGAFTGANTRKHGLFEFANSGTVFLDEISELGKGAQAKLLRVLQQREFRRIGGRELIPLDIRIISAMNKRPKREIQEGRFREDLFFRLNVIPILLPPLRQRKSDIQLLVNFFLQKLAEESKSNLKEFTSSAIEVMENYKWPGNVRQLQNIVERTAVLSNDDIIDLNVLPDYLKTPPSDAGKEEEVLTYKAAKKKRVELFEREYFKELLVKSNSNVMLAASLAGISEKTLYRAIKKYNELQK